MIDHQLYERLCTLAATGQLSASEKVTFDEHCLHCPTCGDHLLELALVTNRLLLHVAAHATPAPMPAGSLERFRARAIREGIALHPVPTRSTSSFTLASATAVLIIIAMLGLLAHGRKAPEIAQLSIAAPTSIQQHLRMKVTLQAPAPRLLQAGHAHLTRRNFVSHTNPEVNDASLAPQRFPQAITASYPFFEPQGAPKPSPIGYPALSHSQILRLDLFPNLDDASSRKTVGIATLDRPIDITSTGKVFDFAANIRQLHFQLPTAQ